MVIEFKLSMAITAVSITWKKQSLMLTATCSKMINTISWSIWGVHIIRTAVFLTLKYLMPKKSENDGKRRVKS